MSWRLIFLVVFLLPAWQPSATAGNAPVVFKVSEGVRPGAIVSLYGEYLTGKPRVRFIGRDGAIAATQAAVQTDPAGHFCRVVFPAIAPGVYKLAAGNGAGWSGRDVFINAADPRWISEERAYPGLRLKLIGRNLDASEYGGAGKAMVRLMPAAGGTATIIAPDAVNPYCVDFTVPSSAAPGAYRVEVNTHSAQYGGKWVRLNNHSEYPGAVQDTVIQVEPAPADPTALALNVAWANDFQWRHRVDATTKFGARGDNATDDTAAIQKAIDDISAAGGGVVYLPNGIYHAGRLVLAPGVVLQGESREQTVLASSSTANEAITVKGSRHGICSVTLKYQPQVPHNLQATLVGGDADELFIHDVTLDCLRSPDVSAQQSPYMVSGAGPMLVSRCRIFISSRNLWNHQVHSGVTFRDNFIDMHAGLGLCMSSEKLLVLNNELVFHPATYAGEMNGFFFNEGWMGWNIYNAYIAGNNVHDLNGAGDCQPYCADSAWTCFAGPVKASGTNSVDVRDEMNGNLKALDKHETEVIVVQGKGMGQLRRVSSHLILGGNPAVARLTVSPQWDVPPDSTSVVTVGSWHLNNVFERNTARSAISPYNMYYGGAYDCVDSDAVSENTEGWYDWGRIGEPIGKAGWLCPVYFEQLKRSTFTGKSPRYSTMGITLRTEYEAPTYRGVAIYGTEIRGNTIDRSACSNTKQRLAGNAAIATWQNGGRSDMQAILATLYEGNTIRNSSVGFDLRNSDSSAISGTVFDNCRKQIGDSGSNTIILLAPARESNPP